LIGLFLRRTLPIYRSLEKVSTFHKVSYGVGPQPIIPEQVELFPGYVMHEASPHWLLFVQVDTQNWFACASMKQHPVPLQVVSAPLQPRYGPPSFATQTYGPTGFPCVSRLGAQAFELHSEPLAQRQTAAPVLAAQTLDPSISNSQHCAVAGHSELVAQVFLQVRLPSPSSTHWDPESQQVVGHLLQVADPPLPAALPPPVPAVSLLPPVPATLVAPALAPPDPAPPLVAPATVPPVPAVALVVPPVASVAEPPELQAT
jgi:hypothetical protein